MGFVNVELQKKKDGTITLFLWFWVDQCLHIYNYYTEESRVGLHNVVEGGK